MKKTETGFTLIELIVAVTIIGIMAAFAYPYFRDLLQNAKYKEAARNIASALRDARSRAVAQNLEFRLEFDLDGGHYWLSRGNRPSGSSTWTKIADLGEFPSVVQMATGTNCTNTDDTDGDDNTETSEDRIIFNPNGSSGSSGAADSPYICIQDEDGNKKFRAGVSSTTTGKVEILRWNSASSSWE